MAGRTPPSTTHVRILGRFCFQGDDVDKPVRPIQAEKGALATRLLIANVLLLDEPTNNMIRLT